MNIRIMAEAAADIQDAQNWYDQQLSGLGSKFREEVYATIHRVHLGPLANRILSKRCRRALVKTFPYMIIYSCIDNELLIVSVAHQHRRPDFWAERL